MYICVINLINNVMSEPMSNLQLELLKLYATNLPESQLLEIKKLLADYFARQIDLEMNALWDEKGWNEDTIEAWKQERLRTRYL